MERMYKHKKENDKLDAVRSMLEEYSLSTGAEMMSTVELSEDQQRALDIFVEGKNVLMMGPGGVGKSKVVREMKYQATKRYKSVVVCGTTGVSAFSIGGITLNSFMGIGTGDQPLETLMRRVMTKRGIRDRIMSTDVLIVDEVSMLSAALFEKINLICQKARRNQTFFGGIQVVFSMDPLQLQPVFKVTGQSDDTRLIYESELFGAVFNKTKKNIINLKKNFRQQGDPEFTNLLMRVRRGVHTDEDIGTLKKRMIKHGADVGEDAVYLVTSNRKAQAINKINMDKLKGPVVEYLAQFTEYGAAKESDELMKDLQTQFEQKGIMKLELKQGARVMMIKNVSVEEGLVNGSVGTIVDFENGLPIVKFDNGIQRAVNYSDWELEVNNAKAKASQIPLMLCWGITVHKIQSLTLDKAVMDLADCFCDGQVYVALSRMRSIDKLHLKTFDPKKISVCEKTKKFVDEHQ
jgi:ATP-dependent DNA helicase PIF1